MFMNILFFLMFLKSKQPIFVLISILGQTMSFIYMMHYFMDNAWFSLSIILVYLGGVLVIFLYLNSVSNMLVMKMNFNIFYIMTLTLLMLESKNLVLNLSQMNLKEMFYSMKEFYFIWFILILFLLIYMINNLMLNMKSPMNMNL